MIVSSTESTESDDFILGAAAVAVSTAIAASTSGAYGLVVEVVPGPAVAAASPFSSSSVALWVLASSPFGLKHPDGQLGSGC